MNEPWWQYVNQNKAEKIDTAWSHLWGELNNKNWTGRYGESLSLVKGDKISIIRWIRSEDIIITCYNYGRTVNTVW